MSYAAKPETETEVDRLRRELMILTTGGIVEVAARNVNVADYMRHWEMRAEKAEAEVARLTTMLDLAMDRRK